MKLILFFIVVVIATSGKQIWDYQKYLKGVKNYEEEMKTHFEQTKMPKSVIIGNTLVSVLCVIFAVAILLYPELTKEEEPLLYVGFFLIIALMIFTLNFTGKQKRCIYYSDEGFYNDGKLIRYKSVKNIKPSKGSLSEKDVVLYNQDVIKMHKELAEFVLSKSNKK